MPTSIEATPPPSFVASLCRNGGGGQISVPNFLETVNKFIG